MAQELCANCGESFTITRLECDHCGWAPEREKARAMLDARKAEARKNIALFLKLKTVESHAKKAKR